MTWIGIALIITALLILGFASCYYRLKNLKLSVAKSWRELDRQLQRRYDQLPVLLGGLEAMRAKRLFLQTVLQTRGQAEQFMKLLRDVGGPTYSDMSPLLDAEAKLAHALRELFDSAEELPSYQQSAFRQMQIKISQLDSRVLSARQSFNGTVAEYNRAQKILPTKWVVGFGQHSSVGLYRIASI